MIFVYWAILKWIEFFENMNNSRNSIHGSKRGRGRDFIWFDHFYNDEHNPNNQGGGDYGNDDTDDYTDSPDW